MTPKRKRSVSLEAGSPPLPNLSSSSHSSTSTTSSRSTTDVASPTCARRSDANDSGRTQKRHRNGRPSASSIYTRTLQILWRGPKRDEYYEDVEEDVEDQTQESDDRDEDMNEDARDGDQNAITLLPKPEKGQKFLSDFWRT